MGHCHQAQNQRTSRCRQKAGLPPPTLGLRVPRNGHLWVTCGHLAWPEPEATAANPVPAARASCTGKSDPADPKQLGSVHRRQPSEGLWLLRSLGSRGHTCPGQHHSSMAPAQLTPFQEVCVEHSGTNVRHPPARRQLSRPHTPGSRHSSPVLVSFCPPSPTGTHPRT